MKILIYTFRTFPYKELLEKEYNNIFVFSSLHKDFDHFRQIINESQPDYIIGIARSPWKHSQFEREAVNQFHKKGKIIRPGINVCKLYFPQKGYKSIMLSKHPTDSFCNWTMYKIASYLHGRKTKLLFIHTTEEDIETVIDFIKHMKHEKTNVFR